MQAEDTLQMMLDFYPQIFPTRKHCLDHLFCVIGNGYCWKNGELVDENTDENSIMNRYVLKRHIQHAKGENEDFFLKTKKEFEKNHELDSNFKIPFDYQFDWYPLSKEYSYLYNYPKDIKDDWRKILEETKELLKKDGITY